MAEDRDFERTEPASPRRRERARAEGHVARSAELATFALFAVAAAAFWLFGAWLHEALARLLARTLARAGEPAALAAAPLAARFGEAALDALLAFAPWLALVFAAAAAAPLLLGGWVFSPGRIAWDARRLDPVAGLGRMCSLAGLFSLLKAIAKTVLVGACVAAVLGYHGPTLLALASAPLPQALASVGTLALFAFAAVAAAMALVAAFDVPYQLWDYLRNLRMSRDELRRELKETEGDPHMRARIKSIQREMARRRMMAEVPKADVVVTNPDHYAVALRYRESEMRAPRVVAKGCDALAARIRDLARTHGVPLVEAPALARALYRHAELGAEIPEALYTAVAEVLVYVYRLRSGAQVHPPREIAGAGALDDTGGAR
jgi:flagellar biosynthetic protein FlhB